MAPRIGEKNARGEATRDLLVQTALEELNRSGPVDFSLDAVLRESGVSRGSLYHHFADRSALLAVAEGRFIQKLLKSVNVKLRTQIESAATGDEVFEVIADVFRGSARPVAKNDRRRRLQSIVLSFSDDVLQNVLLEKEREGTSFLIETLETAQERGLIAPQEDIAGVAMSLQALLLGRVLVDQVGGRKMQEATTNASLVAVRALLNPQ